MALCHLLVCNLLLIFIYSISLVELHTAMWPKVKCTQMEPDTARCLCPFIPADIQTTNGRNAMCYCKQMLCDGFVIHVQVRMGREADDFGTFTYKLDVLGFFFGDS